MLAAQHRLVHDTNRPNARFACCRLVHDVTGQVHRSNARSVCYRLVHDDCIICTIACYGIGTVICPMVTVNMEIILQCLLSYSFSNLNRFCGIWYFTFLLNYLQFEFLSVSTYLLRCFAQSAVPCSCILDLNWDSNLRLEPTYLQIWSKHVLLQLPNSSAITTYCALSSVIYHFLIS